MLSAAVVAVTVFAACSDSTIVAPETAALTDEALSAESAQAAISSAKSEHGSRLYADLTGEAEVGGGDPDGSGEMRIVASAERETVCFQLRHSNIARPTRAHIHAAPAGVNGGVVVFLFDEVIDPPIPAPESGRGCWTASADVINDVLAAPDQFYINVHNDEWPGGAIRGQLHLRD